MKKNKLIGSRLQKGLERLRMNDAETVSPFLCDFTASLMIFSSVDFSNEYPVWTRLTKLVKSVNYNLDLPFGGFPI